MEMQPGKILSIDTVQGDDLYWFFEAFRTLSKPEQHVLAMLLSLPDYKFHGTYRDIARSCGLNVNYSPDIRRACLGLESLHLIVLEEPTTWYNRNIYLRPDWLDTFIKLGKGIYKCSH